MALLSGIKANFDQIEAALIKVHLGGFIFQPYTKYFDSEVQSSCVSACAFAGHSCASLTILQSSTQLQPLCFAHSLTPVISFQPQTPVSTIARESFKCRRARRINLPSSVSFIERMAVFHYLWLSHCNLPPSLRFIERLAFTHTALESVIVSASVVRIESDAFCGCHCLLCVTVNKKSQLAFLDSFSFSETARLCRRLGKAYFPRARIWRLSFFQQTPSSRTFRIGYSNGRESII
jgi:hypothetical protein